MVPNDSSNPAVSVPAPPKLGRVWDAGNGAETDSILNIFAQKEKEAAASLSSIPAPITKVDHVTSNGKPVATEKIKPMNDNPSSIFLNSPTSTFEESNDMSFIPSPTPPSQPLASLSIPRREPTLKDLSELPPVLNKPVLRRGRHSRIQSELPTTSASLFPQHAPTVDKKLAGVAASAAAVPKASGKNYFDLAANFDPVASSFSAKSHDDQDEDIVTSMLNESVFASKSKVLHHHKKKNHSRGRSLDFASMNLGSTFGSGHPRTTQPQTSLSNCDFPLQQAKPITSDDASIVAVCEGIVSKVASPSRPNKPMGVASSSLVGRQQRVSLSHLPHTAEEVTTVAQQLRMGSPLRASSPLLTSLFDLPNPTGSVSTSTATKGISPNKPQISAAALAASQRDAVKMFPDTSSLLNRPSYHAPSRHSRSKSAMPTSSSIVFGEVTSHIHANINASGGQQQSHPHPFLSSSTMVGNANKLDHPFNNKSDTRSLKPPSPPKPTKKVLKENKQDNSANEMLKQHGAKKAPHRRHMTMDSARFYHKLSNDCPSTVGSQDEDEKAIVSSLSKDSNATAEISAAHAGKRKDKAKKKDFHAKEKQPKENLPSKDKKGDEEAVVSTPTTPRQKKPLQSCLKTPTSNDFTSPKPSGASAAGKKTPSKKASFLAVGKSPGRTIKPKPSLKGGFSKQQFKEMFPSLVTKKKTGGDDSPDRRDEQENVADDFDLIQLSSEELSPERTSQEPSLEQVPSTTFSENIVLRSSEIDPSAHQLDIPLKDNVRSYAQLCELFEHYREVDQNFDFASLKGVTKYEIDGMCIKTNIRYTHRIDGSLMETVTFTEDHRSILEMYGNAGRDFVLEDYILVGTREDPTCEVAIFCSQFLRQFVVLVRGSTEFQSKPFKNAQSGFSQESFTDYLEKVEVGCGFSHVYHEKENVLETKVFHTLNRLKDDNPFFDVIMTGHSFGGALATLVGAKYAAAHSEIRVSVIPFGCPKIGSTQFRSFVHSLPNLNVFRIELPSDPFVTMPNETHLYGPNKWSHVGHSIVLVAPNNSSGLISKTEARVMRFDGAASSSGASAGGSASSSSNSSGSKLFSSSHLTKKMTASMKSTTKKHMSDYLLYMDICYRWPNTFYTQSEGITSEIDQEERYVV